MSVINNQDAVIWNPGTKPDRYGNEVEDWSSATDTPITDVSVQPSSTTEVVDDQQTTVADWRFYSTDPACVAMTAQSRIECQGQTYEVVGAPQPWPDPLEPGAVDHWEAPLRVILPNPEGSA